MLPCENETIKFHTHNALTRVVPDKGSYKMVVAVMLLVVNKYYLPTLLQVINQFITSTASATWSVLPICFQQTCHAFLNSY